MANEEQAGTHAHARGGYDFRIEVRIREYPWAAYRYWARVTGAVRHDPASTLTADQLPFSALQCHGATAAEVVEQVRRQIDQWFEAYPDAGSR